MPNLQCQEIHYIQRLWNLKLKLSQWLVEGYSIKWQWVDRRGSITSVCPALSLVKIRLYTKNQISRISRTALIVIIPGVVVWCCGVVWSGFLTDTILIPPQQKLF